MNDTTKPSKRTAFIVAAVAAALAVAGLEPPANQAVGEYLVALIASIF